ncbi:hypothetical protein Ocin01_00374 [Orchesella cincta]|uniref:Uncharacterized protein n=1 Tax=Orchesella cincta TaxID=48709 RepID=A0A1D2NLZ9_ORCCI|nr:hypothetical protein Ocin01_00374 [Orchesella cincta]
MSDLAEKLDLSRYVPQNYPDLMYYKSYGCPPSPVPCPKVPCYTKDFFCSEWGSSFKCICPQRRSYRSPYQGVREEMASMDYYTKLPEFPPGCYPRFRNSPRFQSMAEKYSLDDINDCPSVKPGWSPNCPENRKVFNLLHKDAVCGLCVPPQRARRLPVEGAPDCSDECQPNPEDMYDLPFRVKVLGAWPQDIEKALQKKSAMPKTGAARCLHPSTSHDLQSTYKESFNDFFKTKTRKQLKLYRSPLAIDISRPRLSIPTNPQQDLVLSGPITVNALPLVMRPKGPQKLPRNVGPKFEVIVQGPICI